MRSLNITFINKRINKGVYRVNEIQIKNSNIKYVFLKLHLSSRNQTEVF